jgi:hypothetical protein
MSLLLNLQADIVDYVKAMPETGKAKDLDFEVWGKGFCSLMVRGIRSLSPRLLMNVRKAEYDEMVDSLCEE